MFLFQLLCLICEFAAAGAVARGSGAAHARDVGPFDLCWVHVGKTGGMSVTSALTGLEARGELRFVQIHSDHERFRGKSLPGPLIRGGRSEQACVSAGRVLMVVRDPISRFVSTWRAALRGPSFSDSPMLPRWLADHGCAAEDGINNILRRLIRNDPALVEDLFNHIEHANMGISFYMGPRCEALDRLPQLFVGRQESLGEDWERFQALVVKRPAQGLPRLPHLHGTGPAHDELTQDVVDFLRVYFTADYGCLRKLASMRQVPPGYSLAEANVSKYTR